MNHSTHVEILVVIGAEVFTQKSLGAVLAPTRQKLGATILFLVHLLPVGRRVEAEVQSRAGVPFLAGAAFPAEVFEIIEGHHGACVADASALVTAGTQQYNLR